MYVPRILIHSKKLPFAKHEPSYPMGAGKEFMMVIFMTRYMTSLNLRLDIVVAIKNRLTNV